jgi:hypothetical protein
MFVETTPEAQDVVILADEQETDAGELPFVMA